MQSHQREITVVEVIYAVPGKGSELKNALADIVSICRLGTGCLQYDLLIPMQPEEKFLILMRWKSMEDLQRHETSTYIQNFIGLYDGILYKEVTQTEWLSA